MGGAGRGGAKRSHVSIGIHVGVLVTLEVGGAGRGGARRSKYWEAIHCIS